MRFHTRGLDGGFTYPCAKADVREAFGEDILELVWLGGYSLDHYFNRREVVGEVTGRVILTLSISTSLAIYDHPVAYFHAYRVPKADWSEYLYWQTREIMRTKMRPWADAMLARPETACGLREEMLVEMREGVLRLHMRRAR